MARPIHEQLAAARERAKIKKSPLGRELGWKDNTHVMRVERGEADTTMSSVEKWADICGHEVLIVPKGAPESVLGRAHEANERELRLAALLLDFLLEFRDEEVAIDYFERDISNLRERLRERRRLLKPSA